MLSTGHCQVLGGGRGSQEETVKRHENMSVGLHMGKSV